VNIPTFLLPIAALEIIAALAVICGVWMLLTGKVDDARTVDRAERTYRERAAKQTSPTPVNRRRVAAAVEDDLALPKANPSQSEPAAPPVDEAQHTDEINPDWPAPTPKKPS
jgi:hypothetical protein